MVLCFIALGVFSVLGIFSAKYRAYAKEAFSCVVKKATLRKCDSDLDLRMKSEIVGKLIGVNKSLAGFTNRHFELLSWIFTLLMLISFVYSAYSVYNYVAYGNCNGAESTGFCIFDPGASGEQGFSRQGSERQLVYPPSLTGHTVTSSSATADNDTGLIVIEYGCYTCPFTKKAEESAEKIRNEYKDRITFVYKHMPIDSHPYSWEAANAAECADEQGKFWEYRKILFDQQSLFREQGTTAIKEFARELIPNQAQFEQCIDSRKYFDKINVTYSEGKSIGIYGTPTFFIGNRTFVGNVDYYKLKDAIEEELK